MSYRLIYPDSYLKRAKKFLKKHPEIRGQYQKTLELLELNPHHPSLRLQGLQGRLGVQSSASINLSYHITLTTEIQDSNVILIDVGHYNHVSRYRG
ncbi:plasmid stabilization protein [Thiohalocapsa marina]|uniref:Plasmid stabilization protein n=1 Tax=Thiohalocapsa marina TaxID=424902 RepID=A0A5M8FT74_9GAMM|nr:plasmid stabilization protein [Thiohalocapsa marina]KAA6187001.1 plasmid stabilization protein [Thiohalocapsa marina]